MLTASAFRTRRASAFLCSALPLRALSEGRSSLVCMRISTWTPPYRRTTTLFVNAEAELPAFVADLPPTRMAESLRK